MKDFQIKKKPAIKNYEKLSSNTYISDIKTTDEEIKLIFSLIKLICVLREEICHI